MGLNCAPEVPDTERYGSHGDMQVDRNGWDLQLHKMLRFADVSEGNAAQKQTWHLSLEDGDPLTPTPSKSNCE